MAWQNDFRLQVHGAGMSSVKIVQFKPEEYAVSMRKVGITDLTVMMLVFPAMELAHQLAFTNESLVIRSTMGALAAEQALIPSAARLDIAHADERLRKHRTSVVLRDKVYIFAEHLIRSHTRDPTWQLRDLARVCAT